MRGTKVHNEETQNHEDYDDSEIDIVQLGLPESDLNPPERLTVQTEVNDMDISYAEAMNELYNYEYDSDGSVILSEGENYIPSLEEVRGDIDPKRIKGESDDDMSRRVSAQAATINLDELKREIEIRLAEDESKYMADHEESDAANLAAAARNARRKSLERYVPFTPVVEHVFNRSTINEVLASSGIGKTTLMARMGACVSLGSPFLDAFRTIKGKVLVFSEDDAGFENMLKAIEVNDSVELSREDIKVSKNFPNILDVVGANAAWGDALNARLEGWDAWAGKDGISLMIFDTKSAFMGQCRNPIDGRGLEENDNNNQQLLCDRVLRLARRFRAAAVFISHPTKGSENQPNQTLSSRGGGAARAAMWKTFSLVKKGDSRIFTADKTRGGGFGGKVELSFEYASIVPEDELPEMQKEYESLFSGSEKPSLTIKGVPSTPFRVGLYQNTCSEPGDAPQDEPDSDESRKRKWKPSVNHEVASEVLMRNGGRMLRPDLVSAMIAERGESELKRANAGMAVAKMIEMGHFTTFHDEASGQTYITSMNASPRPFA